VWTLLENDLRLRNKGGIKTLFFDSLSELFTFNIDYQAFISDINKPDKETNTLKKTSTDNRLIKVDM
jgi:hypothetical protein